MPGRLPRARKRNLSHLAAPPDPSDPFALVGTIFERKYDVRRVVAHGGYGVVYAGRHLALDVPVAIKILKPGRDVDRDRWLDLLAQFLDEAKTLARLRHPNIVSVIDAGISDLPGFDETVPWMVLEWLEGETLRDALARRRGSGGRSVGECMALVRPVLEAIAEAHDAGVVHRDLKPSNLMLVPTKRGTSLRVVDFGIAKIVQPEQARAIPSGVTVTDSRDAAFSVVSASPEQLSGGRTGPWTDVFALGLLVTELLADEAALPSRDPTEHYRAVFAAERPTPRKLGVDAGPWEEILARALAVHPAERHADARALLADLESTVSGTLRGVVARVVERPEQAIEAPRGARWRMRMSPVAVGITAAALVVGSAAMALRPAPGERARSGGLLAGDPAPVSACSNKGCTADLGEPALCKQDTGTCVALQSEDCVLHAEPGDLERDDTVIVGSMFPRTGQNGADYGMWNHHAVELARRDFAQTMGSVAGERARPLAVLECDDEIDAKRAAEHLVNDVGVPAVIGFRSGMEAIGLASSLFVPHGVLTMVATNTNPMISLIPHPPDAPRLVFRTTYSTADAAAAIGRLVTDVVEPDLRALPSVGAKRRLRVASLRSKAASGSDLGSALLDNLRFNAKSALANGDDYREISFAFDAPDGSAELAAVSDALLSFQPEIIVYAGGHAATHGIVAPVEARWPRGAVRPRWISIAELSEDVFAIIGRDEERRRRFFGVTPVSETAANARFVTHYRESFPEPVSRTESPNSTYDAFYLLAFASYAIAAGEPVTGAQLARGLAQLVPPGKPIEVGTPGIFGAYAALSRGERVDVTGATGRLDFDLARGESSFDHSILCVGTDASGRAASGVPSGLVYVAATQKLEGEMRCP